MKLAESTKALEAIALAKSFGTTPVLQNIDFSLHQGEVIALLGPSGCGKTTLLRIAAGLLNASSGSLFIAGTCVVKGSSLQVAPEKRGIGMVFQDYAIWPHLSVLENVSFPLRMRNMARQVREQKALEALRRVGLADLSGRYPGTLSGGQQQRVALARAIVAEPPLVLFDEPLSNLDRELREDLALEIGMLLRELELSAIYVTHDQAEAFTIADRVAVMLSGNIAQMDKPEVLFSHPASAEVAQFLNIGALLDVNVKEGTVYCGEGQNILFPDLLMDKFTGRGQLLVPRMAVRVDSQGHLQGKVLLCQFQGDRYLLHLALLKNAGTIVCPSEYPVSPDEVISLSVDERRLRLFPYIVKP